MKKLVILSMFIGVIGFCNVLSYQFTTLTTPNTSEALGVMSFKNHSLSFTTTGVSTDVVLAPQASLDGSNWFSLNDDESDVTITSNTTKFFHKSDLALSLIRIKWLTKSGIGTTPNISIMYQGNN